MTLEIRDAVEADLPAIVEIHNSTVPTRVVTADTESVSVEAGAPGSASTTQGDILSGSRKTEGRWPAG